MTPPSFLNPIGMSGHILSFCGDFVLACSHFEKSIMLYDPQQHGSHASLYGQDPGVAGLSVWVTSCGIWATQIKP